MIYSTEEMEIVELGTGDVLVTTVIYPDNNKKFGVGFSNQKAQPIGEFRPELEGKTESECNVSIKLDFTKPESVQVVIDHLREIKERLLEVKE